MAHLLDADQFVVVAGRLQAAKHVRRLTPRTLASSVYRQSLVMRRAALPAMSGDHLAGRPLYDGCTREGAARLSNSIAGPIDWA